MKLNYDFGRLGITEANKEEYIRLLEFKQSFFVPAKYVQMDKVSIEIEYEVSNLLGYEDLFDTNNIFILQAMMSLATLSLETNELMNISLEQDNIYFDQGANAYQLVREINPKQKDEEQLVQQIKALLGNLFIKEGYESILASNGKLLEKNSLLKSLAQVDKLTDLRQQLAVIIASQIKNERETKVTVDKNYVNKVKRLSSIKTIVIAILIVVSGFLAVIFIPNRTSQLHAIDSYEAATYENVLADLHDTKVATMSPVMKYMMAESTIKLSQLTDSQKDNILYNLSPSVEENILDFWVYIGQDDLDRAYDQSIKNNDAQQKAYVLLLLIDQTQNDSSLKTDEKESKLATYQGELDSITGSMEADQEED